MIEPSLLTDTSDGVIKQKQNLKNLKRSIKFRYILAIQLLGAALQNLSFGLAASHGETLGKTHQLTKKIIAPYAAFAPLGQVASNFAKSHRPPAIKSLGEAHLLPNGPAPHRPSALLLALTGPQGQHLDRLQQTVAYQRIHKTRVYHLFADLLRHLNLLVDRFASKKMDVNSRNFGILQTMVKRVALKNGRYLKLKWPLVLLNPHFLREILSSPTFLVMLFHAVEVAYSSLPNSYWLRPAMKLVAQPSFEHDERTWWRRKRIYEALNGRGSSELQPNLRTIHFREPGEPISLELPPKVAYAIRGALRLPPVNPTYYQQPREQIVFASGQTGKEPQLHQYHYSELTPPSPKSPDVVKVAHELDRPKYKTTKSPTYSDHESTDESTEEQSAEQQEEDQKQQAFSQSEKYEIEQEVEENRIKQTDVLPSLLTNELQRPVNMPPNGMPTSDDLLSSSGKVLIDQIMSPSEFNALDPRDKDYVIRETKRRLEESRWTNELIKQHSDLVESMKDKPFRLDRPPPAF